MSCAVKVYDYMYITKPPPTNILTTMSQQTQPLSLQNIILSNLRHPLVCIFSLIAVSSYFFTDTITCVAGICCGLLVWYERSGVRMCHISIDRVTGETTSTITGPSFTKFLSSEVLNGGGLLPILISGIIGLFLISFISYFVPETAKWIVPFFSLSVFAYGVIYDEREKN